TCQLPLRPGPVALWGDDPRGRASTLWRPWQREDLPMTEPSWPQDRRITVRDLQAATDARPRVPGRGGWAAGRYGGGPTGWALVASPVRHRRGPCRPAGPGTAGDVAPHRSSIR